MALILLRRIISTSYDDFWPAVGKEVQEQFYQQVLERATNEQEVVLKKRLTDLLSELARNTISKNFYYLLSEWQSFHLHFFREKMK